MLRLVQRALAPLGKRRVLIVLGSTFAVAAFLAITAGGFAFWWTSQPSFCGRCHPMKPFVQAWEESSHKDVTCENCHTTPGLFGFVGGKVAGLQVVASYVSGDYEDWSFNAAVPNASCLQCHESILEKSIHTRGKVDALVSHSNIVQGGAKCIGCHSTVAHGSSVPIGSQTHATMASCMKCHNDKTAPLRCRLCHTGKDPSKIVPDHNGQAAAG